MPNTPLQFELFFYSIVLFTVVFLWQGTRWAYVRAYPDQQNRYRVDLKFFWGMGLWMLLGVLIAESTFILNFTNVPPGFLLVLFGSFAVTTVLAFSRLGTVWIHYAGPVALIALQSFRLPLEIFLYQAYELGIMGKQMTYVGWNYDILTGISAILLALWLWKKPLNPTLILTWNIICFTLFVIIITTAILTAPTLFQQFPVGEIEVFIAVYFPYILLPMVLVQAAFFGHILLFRWWWSQRSLNKR